MPVRSKIPTTISKPFLTSFLLLLLKLNRGRSFKSRAIISSKRNFASFSFNRVAPQCFYTILSCNPSRLHEKQKTTLIIPKRSHISIKKNRLLQNKDFFHRRIRYIYIYIYLNAETLCQVLLQNFLKVSRKVNKKNASTRGDCRGRIEMNGGEGLSAVLGLSMEKHICRTRVENNFSGREIAYLYSCTLLQEVIHANSSRWRTLSSPPPLPFPIQTDGWQ